MSRIAELGDSSAKDIKKRFAKLPVILAEYESVLEDAKKNIEIEGKRLEIANREQPVWMNYYFQKKIELNTLVKYIESQVQRVRGKLFRSYDSTMQRDLSDRAKDKYIDNEDAYLEMFEIYLEVKETYDKYSALVDVMQQRGYSLNNITKIRVASLEDVEI